MLNRHKVYLGLAVSASVCAGLSLYLFFRYQQQRAASKAGRRLSPVTDLPSLASPHDYPSAEPTSPTDIENEDSDTVQVLNEIQIPGGGVPLTPDQASILTRFLYEIVDDEEQLHRVLTSIANASTFKESQINLANAGCITRLRELLLATENDDTICRILLALNNLPLNDFAIMQFSNVVPIVIGLCRISALNSPLRRYGLTLLINMSVLDYLHDEYMSNIYELGLLVESTTESDDEALSAAKILVNLSNNRANLENLLKLPGVELKFIINLFTSKTDQSSKAEDVLQRFLIFYCNVAEGILQVFKEVGDANNNNNTSWLLNPTPQRKRVLYFEFFDHDKQDLAKSLLRPHHTSSSINTHMKRLYQLMDKIQHSQPKSAVASLETACSTSNSNPNAPSSNEFTQR